MAPKRSADNVPAAAVPAKYMKMETDLLHSNNKIATLKQELVQQKQQLAQANKTITSQLGQIKDLEKKVNDSMASLAIATKNRSNKKLTLP